MVELKFLLMQSDRKGAGKHNVKMLRAGSSWQKHCVAEEMKRKGALPHPPGRLQASQLPTGGSVPRADIQLGFYLLFDIAFLRITSDLGGKIGINSFVGLSPRKAGNFTWWCWDD